MDAQKLSDSETGSGFENLADVIKATIALAPDGIPWQEWRRSQNIEDERNGTGGDLPLIKQLGIKKSDGGMFSSVEKWADNWWANQESVDRFMGWLPKDFTGSTDSLKAFVASDEFKALENKVEAKIGLPELSPEENDMLRKKFEKWWREQEANKKGGP